MHTLPVLQFERAQILKMTQTQSSAPGVAASAPTPGRFHSDEFLRWWELKQRRYQGAAHDPVVELSNPRNLTEAELDEMKARIAACNFVIYQFAGETLDQADLSAFATQLGLGRYDDHLCAEGGFSELSQDARGEARHYIPYTNRPLGWHTDGYYHPPSRRIRAFLLHCVSDADQGGETELIDHEMVYGRLREQNASWTDTLSEDVMMIPPNVGEDGFVRPAVTGPVFWCDEGCDQLYLRYTARTRSIEWQGGDKTRRAVLALKTVIDTESDIRVGHRLLPGQGLLSNNVLHRRTGFEDNEATGKVRRIYRARFYDAIDTGAHHVAFHTPGRIDHAVA